MSWATFVAAGIGPWAKKAATALGFGVVSYVGFDALQGQIAAAVNAQVSGLGADVYAILALAGFLTLVQIWLSAFSAVVALLTFKRLGLLT